MEKTALCVAAHPDDIEFMMAGTLILLAHAGYQVHYLTIANGCCGTAALPKEEIVAVRGREAREAAALIGAHYHPPLVDDVAIFYEPALLGHLAALVRRVNPEILLLPSPQDYMEDHMAASRVMVTAAFCRSMPNYPTDPPIAPVEGNIALYHALPYGLRDELRQRVIPECFVDISGVMPEKRQMLACHRSQQEWLDQSQGIGSYLKTMEEMAAEVGRLSGRWIFAEGWRRHSHLGFAPPDFDPMATALSDNLHIPIRKEPE